MSINFPCLPERTPSLITDMVTDIMAGMVNADCAYQMAGCSVPGLDLVWSIQLIVFTARCYASAVLAMGLCPSVCLCLCLSQAGVLLKRQNVGSHKQHHTIPQRL